MLTSIYSPLMRCHVWAPGWPISASIRCHLSSSVPAWMDAYLLRVMALSHDERVGWIFTATNPDWHNLIKHVSYDLNGVSNFNHKEFIIFNILYLSVYDVIEEKSEGESTIQRQAAAGGTACCEKAWERIHHPKAGVVEQGGTACVRRKWGQIREEDLSVWC